VTAPSEVWRFASDPLALGLGQGKFTVAVEWSAAANMQRFQKRGRELTSVFEFEVREVLTSDDEVDLCNHLASHALLDGRPHDALPFIERVLRQRPSNATALTSRARVRSVQGACVEAEEDLQKAARIIEAGLDKGNQSNARLGEEGRRAAAENLRNQARALKCP
jgi:Flp pilus assembly protein TadD